MNKKMSLMLAALLALPVLVGPSAQAAAPAWSATISFVGEATISGGGICYPTQCGKQNRTFRLRTPHSVLGQICEGVSASSKKGVAGPDCSIDISGDISGIAPGVGPWCGHSVGSNITGTITVGGHTYTVVSGTYVSAASNITANGTATKGGGSGPWAATVNASPDATQGQSCAGPNGASIFLVSGTATVTIA